MTIEDELNLQKKINSDLHRTLAERDAHIAHLLNSTSWRITLPLRVVAHFLKQLRRSVELLWPAVHHSGGLGNAVRKAIRLYRHEGLQGLKRGFRFVATSALSDPIKNIPDAYLDAIASGANARLATRVLIIAEMSIAQCKKYRVQQKLDMLASLGVKATALSWNDTAACMQALQTHTVVIFYRVPAFPNVVSVVQEAKRLRLTTFWEVDDLIFDRAVLANSKTLAALDKNVFDQLLEGAVLYKNAMLLCDRGIASTAGLAHAMRLAGLKEVAVVENALDMQTLKVAQRVRDSGLQKTDDAIRIVYGSGTNTHNIDFEEAVPALLQVLEQYPQARLRIVGSLDFPQGFDRYMPQIERIAMCTYEEYMTCLAQCDISIAPLENYVFNDSKSNIKYIEASILGIPSACSPRAAFSQIISHGENGYLCETTADWVMALSVLITQPEKRAEMGACARALVLRHYAPENIAANQLAPLLAAVPRQDRTTRVLSVNCYYSPRSFGGATIVAEEVNQLLGARDDFEMHVFTAIPTSVTPAYSIKRYESKGHSVFGMGLPDHLDEHSRFDNPDVVKAFEDVIDVVQPNIVHFHSIQGIGVGAVDLCIARGIPYVITLHDAWWVCGRQFMINREGKYCHQVKIDLELCAKCVENRQLNQIRNTRLETCLRHAAVLLSPSRFFADFYISNGWCQVQVNKNGVIKPKSTLRYRQSGGLRFGYVGGNTEIKGFHLVKKVFSDLAGLDVRLILVDNAINLGFSSYHATDLEGLPQVQVVPAYTQATMDAFFESIDVLLFPTQWKESFGLTIREALVRNVWVITTDAGGVVEDIEVGKNGYIIPLSDTGEELKKAVVNTIRHFAQFKPGDAIELPTQTITFFEDQASELAGIFKKIHFI
jgi:glycosyltransferase involved in cell wall biosynthesis